MTLTVKCGYPRQSIHPHTGYDAATEHGDERHSQGGSSVTGGGVFFTSGAGTESVSVFDKHLRGRICTHRARAERHDKLAID